MAAKSEIQKEWDKGNVVPYWDNKIYEELVGFEIVGARYMKDVEKPAHWDLKAPMILLRKPKSKTTYFIMAQMDDEGNNAGVFAYGCYDPEVEVEIDVFPVI